MYYDDDELHSSTLHSKSYWQYILKLHSSTTQYKSKSAKCLKFETCTV